MKFLLQRLRALTGAERRLLERRADSCTPRQVKSPRILAPRSLLHCFFATKRHRGDGKRFVMQADEKVTAFFELESVIRAKRTRPIANGFSPATRLGK